MEITRMLKVFNDIKTEYEKTIIDKTKNVDIKVSESKILLFLYNNKEYNRAKDIVEMRGFAKSYVSSTLKTLEDKKYISVNTNINNRREQNISITDRGFEVLKCLKDAEAEAIIKIKENFGNNNFVQLIKIINSYQIKRGKE